MNRTVNEWFENKREYGLVAIRLVVGAYLVYVQQNNVFNPESMAGVAQYFDTLNIPMPALSAYVSVYAQFIAGLLFIVGAFTRYAAAAMVINFVVAFIAVDFHRTYPQSFPAQIMLSSAILFLFCGSGPWSVDHRLKSKKQK
jgi:putative oxidoreductase